jgi:Ser/Thr protein kinase RdoA (MazF antagonist)
MSTDRRLDPLSVAGAFGLPDAVVRSMHTGFSGATVFRVSSGELHFAVKSYPRDWGTAGRLSEIHRWVTKAGSQLMPQPRTTRHGTTAIENQGRLWETLDWCEGTPATDGTVALESVARLHVRWQQAPLMQPCPTVLRQWAVLDEWQDNCASTTPSNELIQLTELLSRLIEPARDQVRPWLSRPVPLQNIHGDLWPGNVLIHNRQVSGIIDCAAVRQDSVASDLARLCSQSSAETNRCIADSYELLRPLQPVEWELFKCLCRTGPVARLAQWLKWLVVDRREFADPEQARRRLAEIVEQARRLE